jgi:DNA polymerase-3 subunit epsilon
MKDFAAIDFETANEDPASVCSVGVVVVRDGIISERIYSLIKPEPEWYAYWNTRVHGLTEKDTWRAPAFADVWREIGPQIEGLPLVAHNSAFDERCLKAAFKTYGMTYPNYVFHCTCRAARAAFGRKILPNHKLHTVAAHCGYDLRNHHHALADAEACAVIALQIL